MANASVSVLGRNIFDDTPVGELSDGELTDRVVGFAGQIAALTARFVELLAEFDDRRAWSGEGVRSCAALVVVAHGVVVADRAGSGAGGACAKGFAADSGGVYTRPVDVFEGAGDHPGGDCGA